MAELPLDTRLRDGHYSVGPVLGVSNFGITYEGHDHQLGRRVAIKELYPAGSQRNGNAVITPATMTPQTWEKMTSSFVREATTLGRLDHPSIVTVYDYFNENNTAYMVMKFISGLTLERYVATAGGRLSEAEAVNYTVQIGQALEVLHAVNILHRDIKPSNIIRAGNGQVVLIDFGSAREFAPDHTVMQTAFATRGFTPPEQFTAFGRKGPYTDVYSLAATTYYLLTGRLIDNRLEEAASPTVMAALRHALIEDPKQRTQTVQQFLFELLGQAAPVAAASPRVAPPAPIIPTPPPPTATPPAVMPRTVNPTPPQGVAVPPALINTPPPPQSIDATTVVPEYLINAPARPPAAPPTTIVREGMPPPTPVFQAQAATQANQYPPNQPYPPYPAYPPQQQAGMPPYAPYPPQPVPAPQRKRPVALIILLVLLLLAAIAAVVFLLMNNKGNDTSNSGPATVAASPTTTAVAQVTATPQVVVAQADTPTALSATATPAPQETDTPAPQDTDTPLPQDTATTAPAPSDTPAPPPSDTPVPPPADTPVVAAPPPAANTPRPKPTATKPKPKPTATLPKPSTATPVPPPPPPTKPPAPQPPPNPTNTAAGALGAGWQNLGPLDFNAYCARQFGDAVGRAGGGALSWTCISRTGELQGRIDMAAACTEQSPGFNLTAQLEDPKNPDSWYCYRGGTRVKAVNESGYCQRHYPGSNAALEDRSDVEPALRWACFKPKTLGSIDVQAACSNQFGAGAYGYWSDVNNPASWRCYRR